MIYWSVSIPYGEASKKVIFFSPPDGLESRMNLSERQCSLSFDVSPTNEEAMLFNINVSTLPIFILHSLNTHNFLIPSTPVSSYRCCLFKQGEFIFYTYLLFDCWISYERNRTELRDTRAFTYLTICTCKHKVFILVKFPVKIVLYDELLISTILVVLVSRRSFRCEFADFK